MKSQTLKLFIVAVVCYVGAGIARYIAKIPPPPLNFIPMTDGPNPWSVWDYLSLVLLLSGLGLTIAAIKFIALRREIPRKQKQLDL